MRSWPGKIRGDNLSAVISAVAQSLAPIGLAMLMISGLIIGLSSNYISNAPIWAEMLIHAAAFAAFTLAFGLYFKNMVCALLLALIASVGIEVLQLVIPNRNFSMLDIIANDLGAILAWVGYLYKNGTLTTEDEITQAVATDLS